MEYPEPEIQRSFMESKEASWSSIMQYQEYLLAYEESS